MEKQREDAPPPAPAPEPIIPDYVYDFVTRDYTPPSIRDQETRRLMRKLRGVDQERER